MAFAPAAPPASLAPTRPAAPPAQASRYVFLDGLRGVAALAVLVHHFASNRGHSDVFHSAPLAVDFFFCLSGFVLAHAYGAKLAGGMPFADFARRRIIRLYPMFFIGAVMGLAAIALARLAGMTDLTWAGIAKATLLNALYLPYLSWAFQDVLVTRTFGAVFPANHPAWSLFFELVANAAFAPMARMHARLTVALVAVSAVGLWAAAWAYGRAPGWGLGNLAGGLPRVLFAFFVGTLIYRARERLRLPRIPAAVVLALVVALFAAPRLGTQGSKAYWLAGALVAVPLLVAVAARCTLAPGGALERACTYLGRLSYPVYCIHFPLLIALGAVGALQDGFLTGLALFAALAIALAHELLTHVDEPVRRRLARRFAR